VGTAATLAVTAPGTYTVTATAANGCVDTEVQIITQNIVVPTAVINPPSTSVLTCTTTSISLTASGGTSYSWSNGTAVVGTAATLAVTAPGTYTVTVTAANGCTDTEFRIITQNIAPPTAGINPPNSTILNCTTTSISLTATGGTSYSWSNGTAVVGTTATLPVTAPGTYTVTATNSVNGCTDTEVQIITQTIVPPLAGINPPSTSVLTCSTASISLTATGGTSYSWSNGTSVVGTAATLAVTTPGTYTVTATNSANGCTDTEVQIITQNIVVPTAVISTPSTSVLTCTTTSISLTASGGTSYSWSNGTAVVGTAATLAVTAPGTYTVTVTAANGCTDMEVQTITQVISAPTAGINPPNATEINCTSTSIPLTATGGVSYSWSNGTAVVGTAATLAVTAPGTYTVTATAANGCTDTEVQIITQNIVVPTAVISPPSTSVLTCATTSISLTASGGTSYSWSNGTTVVGTAATLPITTPGTYTVTATAANGCIDTEVQTITQNIVVPTAVINPPSTSVLTCTTTSISLTASGGTSYSWSNGTAVVGTAATLPLTVPGTYTVTATNGVNGCTDTEVQIITQNIVVPTAVISPPSTSVLTCATTSISLTASGGTSYAWSNGNAVVGTAATLPVTSPGTYTVTVTAANGCTDTEVQIITQDIVVPTAVINPPSTSVLTCATTSISLSAQGGTSYSWSNGTTVVGTAATLPVTSPGTYTVTVTAANGCTDTEAQIITQDIVVPTAVINPPSTSVLTCTTTSISLTASGGTSYSWSNGTAVVGTAATLAVTAPGTYTVTATAANGCADTEMETITQNIVSPIVSISNGSNTTVLDCNTSQISLTGNGGLSVTWSNASGTLSNNASLLVTNAGSYTYTGTDANGCFSTETVIITFSPNTDPLFTQIPDICVNGNFSLPSISNNGVQGTWTPSPNFTTTTTYTFQPNAGLCANTTDMTVVVHEYPVISTLNDTICFGQNTSIIPTVDLAGGTYTWSPFTSAAPNITVSPTSTTTYQVVYSLFGCNDTSITEIYVKPVSIPQVANQTICTGENATLTASAGNAGGDFIWSNGQTTSSINVNPSTTTNYSVQYDLDGCLSSSVNSTVTVNPVPTLGVNNVTICAGDIATLTAIVNLPGGTFTWGNPPVAGGSSLSITPLSNTSITVNYSLNGCNSLPATSTITVKPLPIATFTSNVTEGCVPLSVTFTADDPANTDYTWTTSNLLNGNGASSTINFQSSGDFNVSLTTNLNGCIVTETANSYIQVDDYPIASFSSSVLVFSEQNQFVQFENNSIGAASYSWSFGDGQISTLENPDHIFLSTDKGTTILLTAISLHGCTDTVSFEIPFDPGLIYYIPNSFTPDGDMFNQTFQPVFSSGIDPYNYKLRIYNRWGEIIFESNDLSIGWDGSYGLEGTKCQTGTYTYEIIMKMPNFDERTKITGTVNLIR
jgi:gliding motility-associated-like protein